MLDLYQNRSGVYATGLSVSRDKIVTNLADVRSDIWILQLQ
jgi:hypothetical protein